MTIIGASLGSVRPPAVVLHAATTLPQEVLTMLAPDRQVANAPPSGLPLIADPANTSALVSENTPSSWNSAEARREMAGGLRTWPASGDAVVSTSRFGPGRTGLGAPSQEDTVITSLCSEVEA